MGRIKDLPEQDYGLMADTDECLVIDGRRGTRRVPTGRSKSGVIGAQSWAFGNEVSSGGKYSHAEGNYTYADGDQSHAEGHYTNALSPSCHAEGHNTTAGAVGLSSTQYDIAAHAEGYGTTANGAQSHAEGYGTTAKGAQSHAEGYGTTAKGAQSHAQGLNTKVDGDCSFVGGTNTTIGDGTGIPNLTNCFFFGLGLSNTMHSGLTCFGKYNKCGRTSLGGATPIFGIGNGGSEMELSDALVVYHNGDVAAKGSFKNNAADYAEFFEWFDGNLNDEDRVGKFVTFCDGDKIRIADQNDEYILGIVSGAPSICGNADVSTWNGMYLKDDFGRVLYGDVPKMEEAIVESDFGEEISKKFIPVLDENENQVYEKQPIINPEYKPEEPYKSRSIRPEWSPIGMLGVLSVWDDGTCEVNSYAGVGKNGIATKGDKYRVIERVTDNIVKVVFR